ncbi:MAG: hypothetical protein IJ880_00035 [Bacilli bacterium]|nr:hypothetical protein [Bacilli bacterium]
MADIKNKDKDISNIAGTLIMLYPMARMSVIKTYDNEIDRKRKIDFLDKTMKKTVKSVNNLVKKINK